MTCHGGSTSCIKWEMVRRCKLYSSPEGRCSPPRTQAMRKNEKCGCFTAKRASAVYMTGPKPLERNLPTRWKPCSGLLCSTRVEVTSTPANTKVQRTSAHQITLQFLGVCPSGMHKVVLVVLSELLHLLLSLEVVCHHCLALRLGNSRLLLNANTNKKQSINETADNA